LKSQANLIDKNDGSFFMSVKDFFKYWECLDISIFHKGFIHK